MDFDRRRLIEVESQVPIHVIEPHPLDPSLSVATSKRADSASLIDWKRQREVSVLRLPPGLELYGHSAFAPDGKTVLLTALEARRDGTYRYCLLLIDVESFAIREDVTCPIGATHDVAHLDGSLFVIGGGGHPDLAPLALFDLVSGNFRTWPCLPQQSTTTVASHLLATTEANVLAVLSRTTRGSVDDGSLIELDTSSGRSRQLLPVGHADFATELLSFVQTAENRLVWFSVPERRRVVVWNVDDQRVENRLDFDRPPRSLSVLADEGVVTVGTDKGFAAFDARSAKPLTRFGDFLPTTSGPGSFAAHTRLSSG